MRIRPVDDDTLEPLDPIPFVDAPAPSGEVMAAVRTAIAEGPVLRALAPWSATGSSVAPVPQTSGYLSAAFIRMIALHPAQLDGLSDWWCERGAERIKVARRLALDEPRRGPNDTWRVRGTLRSPGRVRSIPVELVLWPRLGSWTKLTLEPQRGVHVGRRYFRSGHRVLDVLCDRLINELVPRPRV